MFDPISIPHDDCVAKVCGLAKSISIDDVARAFVASLSTRRLDWRSAFASHVTAQALAIHKYTRVVSGQSYDGGGNATHTSYTCGVCRDAKYGIVGAKEYRNGDLNVLNFERLKWGGVRVGNLLYTYFDLRQFAQEEIPDPTRDDIIALRRLFTVIGTSAARDRIGTLATRLRDVFPSSDDERKNLVESLAYAGLLAPTTDRGANSRSDSEHAQLWRGEDRFIDDVANKFFSSYL
jgi:hypothetical protein